MLRYCGVFVLAAAFQLISCQGPPPPFPAYLPEECRPPPPDVNPHECCEIPPFLEDSKLTACGIEKMDKPKGDERPPHRHGPPDCSKTLCLLQNEGLLDENEKIKNADMTTFLDKWVEVNPGFSEAMQYAKEQCVKEGGPPGPPHICEADRFFFCMSGNLLFKCPTWKETDSCKKFQERMVKCHKYLIKPAE